MIQRILAISTMLCLSVAAFGADLATKKALTLDVVKEMVKAMEKRAAQDDWKVIICVLDDGGNLLFLERMDGAQVGSIDVAMRKAESAFKFKRPTKAFSDGVGSRVQLVMLPGALAFEGGLPLMVDGEILGAIGVSGVTAEQDGMIAQAGVDALMKIAK